VYLPLRHPLFNNLHPQAENRCRVRSADHGGAGAANRTAYRSAARAQHRNLPPFYTNLCPSPSLQWVSARSLLCALHISLVCNCRVLVTYAYSCRPGKKGNGKSTRSNCRRMPVQESSIARSKDLNFSQCPYVAEDTPHLSL
jgi:hypothetical protein